MIHNKEVDGIMAYIISVLSQPELQNARRSGKSQENFQRQREITFDIASSSFYHSEKIIVLHSGAVRKVTNNVYKDHCVCSGQFSEGYSMHMTMLLLSNYPRVISFICNFSDCVIFHQSVSNVDRLWCVKEN